MPLAIRSWLAIMSSIFTVSGTAINVSTTTSNIQTLLFSSNSSCWLVPMTYMAPWGPYGTFASRVCIETHLAVTYAQQQLWLHCWSGRPCRLMSKRVSEMLAGTSAGEAERQRVVLLSQDCLSQVMVGTSAELPHLPHIGAGTTALKAFSRAAASSPCSGAFTSWF